jgi:hypothetical protein
VNSGKTLISVMLVKEKSRQLAAHLPFGAGRKITVFLAPTVSLVFQVRFIVLMYRETTFRRTLPFEAGRKVMVMPLRQQCRPASRWDLPRLHGAVRSHNNLAVYRLHILQRKRCCQSVLRSKRW